jgi:dipeptidyl-peptidase 4
MTLGHLARSPLLVVAVAAIGATTLVASRNEPPDMAEFFRSRWTYQPSWSPRGDLIAFLQDDWTSQNVYLVAPDGRSPARQVSRSERFIGNPRTSSAGQPPVWAADGSALVYGQDGGLFLAPVDASFPVQLTDGTSADLEPRFSPDGRTISFVRDGEIHVLEPDSGRMRRVTATGRQAGGHMWSPDGRWIAFTAAEVRMFTRLPAYVGRLLIFPFSQPEHSDVGVVSSEGGEVRWQARTSRNEAVLDWSPDSRSLLLERTSEDFKERELLLVSVEGSEARILDTEREETYLPLGRAYARFAGSPDSVVFASERDGWNHLYRLDVKRNALRQLTSGPFEVRDVLAGPDAHLYFTSTEIGPAEPQVFRVPATGGARERLTHGRGVRVSPQVEPAGRRFLYLESGPSGPPDVWVAMVGGGSAPVRVSQSGLPDAVSGAWQVPELVTYRGHDGLEVKAQLFVPRDLDRERRYPAIVHTHQAASYQDVFHGPGPQKDNIAWYAWHQRLAHSGYVVLNVDYRGSIGYGRDYRVANYRDLGGGDRLDAVSGVEYLRSLDFVDLERIGIYGMSYGGHLTLSALARSPGVFRAGINIAGVTDMRMVYETAGRAAVLSRLSTPELEPEAYRRSSAIDAIDNLQAPVMILHGTDDPNVSILQSLRLVDALLERGRQFEFEVYPGELHFFTRARTWRDAFQKMERFFARHLSESAAGR